MKISHGYCYTDYEVARSVLLISAHLKITDYNLIVTLF